MSLSPEDLRAEEDQRRLYELIWKRTLASQMAAARLERTTVEVVSPDARWRCAPMARSCCSTAS
jgi:DNA topoisomerase-1